MITIPLSIAKYIRSMWMAEMIITYLYIDKQGDLVEWKGYPQHYGLTNLIAGQSAVEQVDFLDGMLNIPHTQILQFVSVGRGRSANVHIVPSEKGTYVLMFDATAEHDQQQKMQQQVNDLSLLSYRQSQLLQELEMARQSLAEEKYQLEQASELKSRFIATLSHELRTPLTSIVGYTKLLDEVQQADVREANYLSSVKSNANHLLSLIDNVLEQAKLEAGQIILQPSSCDIKQLFADLKSLFFPTAREKGLIFETDIHPNLPTRVILDELRFRQILINLISNALKFTQQGSVQMTLGWQSNRLEFAVKDTGPGISPQSQQRIFKAFHRDNTAQALPGVGLGLAISQQIITLMEGELKVESLPPFGSTFSGFVKAPLALHTIPNTVENTTFQASETTAKILVADDSIDIRTLMEIYLEEGGYTVISASNGAEAVEFALKNQPDLVLMDMQMPVINGYEAVQQLRTENFTQPIIALSGSTLVQDKNYALEVGCNHYLIKPVSPEDLLNNVEKNLLKK
ncbi:response regulator [Candidatus Parabeggiatoa sp. HSG14]|uniref:response regulator n=1 Tax=Candidatus Parabeggiatoa sp. HSG14 TaxID=3055593 RepID=UPI0025A7E0F8|nr:response regulator [Thiotrichales bacterium HSG14]